MKKQKPTRTPKTYKRTWISTYVEYQIHGEDYVKTREEGYWYEGPLALATTPPNWVVSYWAFYNDGTESGSTPIGSPSENVNPAKGDIDYDTTYLFRVDVEEDSGNASKNTDAQLQYRINTGGSPEWGAWTDVNATSSVIRTVANSNITDGADTTQRLSGTYTFDTTNDGFDDVDGLAGGANADLASTGMEFLYSIQMRSADVNENDLIELSIVLNAVADDESPTYPTWPQITAPASTTPETADVVATTGGATAVAESKVVRSAEVAATTGGLTADSTAGLPNNVLDAYEIWDGAMTAEVAAQDTDPVPDIAADTGYVFVVRAYNNGDIAADGKFELYANNTTKGSGWFAVTASSTYVQTVDVSGLTHSSAVTIGNFKLTGATGTAASGVELEEPPGGSYNLTEGFYTEFWYSFTIVSDDTDDGDNIDLAFYVDGQPPDTFTVAPSVTASVPITASVAATTGGATAAADGINIYTVSGDQVTRHGTGGYPQRVYGDFTKAGVVAETADVVATTGGTTAAAEAKAIRSADVAATTGGTTANANAQAARSASVVATTGSVAAAADAASIRTANAAATTGGITASADATNVRVASAVATTGSTTASADGSVTRTAQVDATAGSVTAATDAVVTRTASAAATTGGVVASADATKIGIATAGVDATVGSITANADAQVTRSAEAAATTGGIVADGNATKVGIKSSNVSAAVGSAVASANAQAIRFASADATTGSITAAADAAAIRTSSVAATTGSVTADSAATKVGIKSAEVAATIGSATASAGSTAVRIASAVATTGSVTADSAATKVGTITASVDATTGGVTASDNATSIRRAFTPNGITDPATGEYITDPDTGRFITDPAGGPAITGSITATAAGYYGPAITPFQVTQHGTGGYPQQQYGFFTSKAFTEFSVSVEATVGSTTASAGATAIRIATVDATTASVTASSTAGSTRVASAAATTASITAATLVTTPTLRVAVVAGSIPSFTADVNVISPDSEPANAWFNGTTWHKPFWGLDWWTTVSLADEYADVVATSGSATAQADGITRRIVSIAATAGSVTASANSKTVRIASVDASAGSVTASADANKLGSNFGNADATTGGTTAQADAKVIHTASVGATTASITADAYVGFRYTASADATTASITAKAEVVYLGERVAVVGGQTPPIGSDASAKVIHFASAAATIAAITADVSIQAAIAPTPPSGTTDRTKTVGSKDRTIYPGAKSRRKTVSSNPRTKVA